MLCNYTYFLSILKMADVQLNDLIPYYPNQDEKYFQSLISGMKEFSQLSSEIGEAIPKRAEGFKHQQLVMRFMMAYDKLYAFHKTGTGKSLTGILSAELAKRKTALDLSDLLMKDPRNSITRTLILVKGKILADQFKKEIVCKGADKGVYETEELVSAKTTRAQKTRATSIVKTNYDITQYGSFANDLEKMTDSDIAKFYSGYFIIFDEIQSLRNNLKKDLNVKSDQDKEKKYANKYEQLKRLVTHAKRSKVLILSATPMVNDPAELALIMNLIYPGGQSRMPLEQDFSDDSWNLEKIEPYLRGRVSAVKELDTGAIPVYKGTSIPNTFEILSLSPMSQFQRFYYDKLPKEMSNFWVMHREALTFVFPNGKYTEKDGFNAFITNSGGESYTVNNELLEYIRNREGEKSLSTLSKKYQDIIDVCAANPRKNCFIFTDYVKGPGAITLGLCFEAQGYKRFVENNSVFVQEADSDGNLSNVNPYCASEDTSDLQIRPDISLNTPRYAIVTRETPDRRQENIQSTFNSFQNRHGEIIQVFIGSRKIREGLNLSNVMIIHLVNGGWNYSTMYQAISRGIRATSHINLIHEKQDNIIGYTDQFDNPNSARFQINEIIATFSNLIKSVDNIDVLPFAELLDNANGAYGEMFFIHNSLNREGRTTLIDINQLSTIARIVSSLNIQNKIKNSILKKYKAAVTLRRAITNFNDDERNTKTLELNGIIRNAVLEINKLFQLPSISVEDLTTIRDILSNGNTIIGASKISERSNLRENIKESYREIIRQINEYVEDLTPDKIAINNDIITTLQNQLANYNNPDNATIHIEIYKHASVLNIRGPDGTLDIGQNGIVNDRVKATDTADVLLYRHAENTDRKISKVERYMKQVAIDGRIHKERNVINDPSKNNTPACDYQLCDYQLYDPEPISIYLYIADQKSWYKIYDRAVIKNGVIEIFDGSNWNIIDLSQFKLYIGTREEVVNPQHNDILLGTGKDAIDDTNYDILYSDRDIKQTTKAVFDIFKSRNRVTYDELYKLLPYHKKRYIIESVIYMIDNKLPIRNRYGVINYVNAENETIFVNPEYPYNPFYTDNRIGLEYYSQNLHGVDSKSLNEIMNIRNAESHENILNTFMEKTVDVNFLNELEELDSSSRAVLLEQALDKYVNGTNNNNAINIILNRFQNQYYFVQAPHHAVQEIIRLKQEKLEGRGRKPSANTKANIKQLKRVGDYVEYADKDKLHYLMTSHFENGTYSTHYATLEDSGVFSAPVQEQNSELIIIHNVYTTTENDTNAGVISRLLRGAGRLRTYSVTGDKRWRDVDSVERKAYTAILQLEISKRFDIFKDVPIYGLITFNNNFRIVQNDNNVYTSKKHLCSSIVGGALTSAEILTKMNIDENLWPDLFNNVPEDVDSYLRGQVDVTNMSRKDKILYYKILKNQISTSKFCKYVKDILEQKSHIIRF